MKSVHSLIVTWTMLMQISCSAQTLKLGDVATQISSDGFVINQDADTIRVVVTDANRSSLSIQPVTGSWDWTKYDRIEIRLKNQTNHALNVIGYAYNPDSNDKEGYVWNNTNLKSQADQELIIPLTRRPETPKPFGKPKYKGLTDEVKIAVGTVRPEAISEIKIKFQNVIQDDRIEIQSIKLMGSGTPSPVTFFPFVDTYGQYIHREWEGKIHNDSELIASRESEIAMLKKMPDLSGIDRFGGWENGPRLNATGHFRTEKLGNRWWLVTPDGTLFFSFGVVGVRSTESGILTGREDWFRELPDRKTYQAAYLKPSSGLGEYDPNKTKAISFLRANLIRKYGQQWQRSAGEVARLRLSKFGFNTMGNWSERQYYLGGNFTYTVDVTPQCRMLRTGWNKFPDVFDNDYESAVDRAMKFSADQTSTDPFNLGYFIDNELGWGVSGRALADVALAAPADQPSKLELIRELRKKYHDDIVQLNKAWESGYQSFDEMLRLQQEIPKNPNGIRHTDLASFQSRMTQRYFELSHKVVRRYAPDKLYLGCRMANYCGLYPDLFAQAAKYCDVVSFNIYRWAPEADDFTKQYDKPVIIGEFGYWACGVTPFNTVGSPGSFPDRGKRMTDYINMVLSRSNFVGCHLYLYSDQVISGRGDGESEPTGLITVTDQPKLDLFKAARKVAEGLYTNLSTQSKTK